MKHKIGDTVKCVKNLQMEHNGKIEFTAGEEYNIINIKFNDYVLTDNSGSEHYMFSGEEYFDLYFGTTTELTPEERFNKAMRGI